MLLFISVMEHDLAIEKNKVLSLAVRRYSATLFNRRDELHVGCTDALSTHRTVWNTQDTALECGEDCLRSLHLGSQVMRTAKSSLF